MALTVKQLLRRHGAFVSAVTAVSVGVAIILLRLTQGFITWVTFPEAGDLFGGTLADAARTVIPFSVGFFISLWLVAPIAEELRIGHVITRAILSTGVGATVLFIVLAVLGIIGAFSFDRGIFANSLPVLFDPSNAAGALGRALGDALRSFVSLLPIGILAGVLLWVWRKDHPPRHPLSGIIDV